MDIDKVATGETWFGEDALARNLCDELRTFDDVVLDLYKQDFDMLSVAYQDPALAKAGCFLASAGVSKQGLLSRIAKFVLTELSGDVIGETPKDTQPLFIDPNADRFRLE